MENTKLIAMILIGLMVVKTEGSLVCYASCVAAFATAGHYGGPVGLAKLGFTTTGIAPGSWAAWWMSLYGGKVAKGWLLSTLQSIAAKGGMKGKGIFFINDVCSYLCYDE